MWESGEKVTKPHLGDKKDKFTGVSDPVLATCVQKEAKVLVGHQGERQEGTRPTRYCCIPS
jgi:hypothetical protein